MISEVSQSQSRLPYSLMTFGVMKRKSGLGTWVALGCGKAVPIKCLSHTPASAIFGVYRTKFELCVSRTVFSSQAIPPDRFSEILRYSLPAIIQGSKIKLSSRAS